MAVGTEVVAVRYEDIVAGTPISVPYPLYNALGILVYYGAASLQAVLNTDYTVSLADDFDTFTLTPTASLLTKINDLIAANPADEVNYITVRRRLDYLTDSTAAAVRYTPFTSREFERTVLRFQQIQEQLNRALVLSPNFVGDESLLELREVLPNHTLQTDITGTRIVPGPTADEVANAQSYAEAAAADRVQTGLDRVATGEDRVQTGLDRVATGLDRVATGLDRVATGEDRVQTGLDRVATGEDRVQTGLDRVAAAAAADTATPAAATATAAAGTATAAASAAAASAASVATVGTRTALKALDTTSVTSAYLMETGREGRFVWRTGNFASRVAADTQEGIYIKADAIATTLGAWVRSRDNLDMVMSWFGARGDGLSDNKAPYDGAAALAKVLGGAVLLFGLGVFAFASDTADVSIADTASITVQGMDAALTAVRFGGTSTRGFKFTSTSTTDQARPAFAVKNIRFMPGAANQGPAVECSWADADYSYTGFTADGVFIDLDGGNNFETGFKLTNAKHLHFSRTTMWGDLTTNASLNAVELAGDCISPSFDNVLMLGWEWGLYITGTTEGVYGDVLNIVACRGGIRWSGGSGLEPVISLSKSNIHTSLYGVWGTNISEASVQGGSFYCYGALNSGSTYTAVLVDGANTRRWSVFGNSFSSDGLGRAGDQKRAIVFNAGSGHQTGQNQIFGADGTYIMTHGVVVSAGASARVFDDPANMSNVTNPISGAGTIIAPWRALRVDGNNNVAMPNGTTLRGRNAANSADIDMIGVTAGNFVQIGLGSNGITSAQTLFPLADNLYDLGFAGALWWKDIYLKGNLRHGANAVVGSRKTGWGAPTGTATRTAFATGSVTTAQLAERVKALIDDLTAHGLIGA